MSNKDAIDPGGALAAFIPPDTSPDDTRIPIRVPVARIGQGPQNDIVLDDDTVSTSHARLEYVHGGWRLTDLESKNGTSVDGVRLAPGIPTPLPGNAEVTFGAHRLIFLPDPEAEPDKAAAAYTLDADRRPLADRTAFRMPVWLLVLILLVVVLLVAVIVVFGGGPAADPVTAPATALGIDTSYPFAA